MDEVPKYSTSIPAPKEVFIDFTNVCNYKCIFCTNCKVKERQTMKLKDINNFKELIGQAVEVDITGWGEVTTHPEFKEIILMLKELNKSFVITTNGYLLSEELITLLKDSPLKQMNISLNSLNKETYKKLTGVDGLDKVLKNIDLLNSGNRSFNLVASFVMNNYNWNELTDIINFGKEKNIHITLFDLTPTIKNYPKGLKVEDTQENRELLRNALMAARHMGAIIFSFTFDKRYSVASNENQIITNCRWPYEKIFIRWNGVVTPCCWCLKEMGNVIENDWLEVWGGGAYSELRNCLKNNNSKYCVNCRRLG